MNPEDAHDGSAETEGGFSYWMLYPSADLWADILDDATGQRTCLPFFATTLIHDPCCREHLLSLCRTLVDPAASTLESDGVLTRALTALARRHGRTPPPAPVERNDPAIQRVHGLLHHEYQRELRLDDLAREAGRSRFWVNRAFAAAYGLPPHTYLTRRRLESARRLLADGEPAAEVAAAVGFADQSHLIRRFKASYGITPGAFQMACKDVQSTI
ncbi:transcriptional regulator, AraC family protein [alpha proteobacterium BAL199]|jgi:AraC-like DNA-binding protein|nr:transcriptional regulator, AraC family protein [alpha proteobacterium BAL199]